MTIRTFLGAAAGAILASGVATTAQASLLLPGSFETEDILATGVSIEDPEGLAVIGDVLWVVDDDGLGGPNTLTSINLNTGAVSQSALDFGLPGPFPVTSVATGTLTPGSLGTPGSVATFSLTSGAGGLTFGAGDTFFVALDNDIGGGFADTTLGSFGAGGLGGGALIGLDDDNSPFGDGRASAMGGFVNPDGSIELAVSGYPDFDFDGFNDFDGPPLPHGESGDFEVLVAVGDDANAIIASALRDLEAATAFVDDTLLVGGDGILVQIDPTTLDVLNAYDLATTTGGAVWNVEGLAFDGTNIFVSAGEDLWVIDPADGSLLDEAAFFGLDIEGLGFDGVNLILGNDASPESLIFVDPNDLSIVGIIGEDDLPPTPGGGDFDPTGVAYSPTLGRIILSDPDPSGVSPFGLITTLEVPVPAPLALLGVGLAALGWTRRRRIG